MNRRTLVVASLVTSLALTNATAAPAQEIRISSPTAWVTPDGSPDIRHGLALARMHADAQAPYAATAQMQEVRLSSGAKTAIIVTAIVVGALIIIGAVALSRPGKHVP